MKKCIKCFCIKDLSSFYKHKKMKDGTLNKCIECCKADSKIRHNHLSKNNPDWKEREDERQRTKENNKYWIKKKNGLPIKRRESSIYRSRNPEKYFAHRACKTIKVSNNHHKHHWSYLSENVYSFFVLTNQEHRKIHRHCQYVAEKKCYMDKKTKEILDTKEKHHLFIERVLNKKITSEPTLLNNEFTRNQKPS